MLLAITVLIKHSLPEPAAAAPLTAASVIETVL
jgi:hypothetical protein